MTRVPADQRIYHITAIDNLGSILADGGLHSDATMTARGGPQATIGMSRIKSDRLTRPVPCHPGDHVGDYVPFYFCPRSVMLFLIHKANDPNLAYRGGQRPIVHLEADLREVGRWAKAHAVRWAFSLANAAAAYAQFFNDSADLRRLEWDHMPRTEWTDSAVKETRQAEFLVHGFFPWHLVRRIGVIDVAMRARVAGVLAGAAQRPLVEVIPSWYY